MTTTDSSRCHFSHWIVMTASFAFHPPPDQVVEMPMLSFLSSRQHPMFVILSVRWWWLLLSSQESTITAAGARFGSITQNVLFETSSHSVTSMQSCCLPWQAQCFCHVHIDCMTLLQLTNDQELWLGSFACFGLSSCLVRSCQMTNWMSVGFDHRQKFLMLMHISYPSVNKKGKASSRAPCALFGCAKWINYLAYVSFFVTIGQIRIISSVGRACDC